MCTLSDRMSLLALVKAVLHVGAELRENAGLRRDEADAQVLRLHRHAERSSGQQHAAKKNCLHSRP
jgi:hypothetical protein